MAWLLALSGMAEGKNVPYNPERSRLPSRKVKIHNDFYSYSRYLVLHLGAYFLNFQYVVRRLNLAPWSSAGSTLPHWLPASFRFMSAGREASPAEPGAQVCPRAFLQTAPVCSELLNHVFRILSLTFKTPLWFILYWLKLEAEQFRNRICSLFLQYIYNLQLLLWPKNTGWDPKNTSPGKEKEKKTDLTIVRSYFALD